MHDPRPVTRQKQKKLATVQHKPRTFERVTNAPADIAPELWMSGCALAALIVEEPLNLERNAKLLIPLLVAQSKCRELELLVAKLEAAA